MRTHKLYYGGSWNKSANTQTDAVLNPATEDAVARFCNATNSDVELAIASAQRGFVTWRETPPWRRGEILKRAANMLRDRTEFIAELLTIEQGKPLVESMAEIGRAADFFEWAGEQARRISSRSVSGREPDNDLLIQRNPVGVVAAFSPWNFPVLLSAKKLSALLAAGCSCILKPSEETPGPVVELVRVLLDAGISPESVNLIYGNPAMISSRLIRDPAIRKVTFTGSIPVGKLLASEAGKYMKPITMELGGHAPTIVFDDVDVQRTSAYLAEKKFVNAGQVCLSPSRFFVHESVYDEFVDCFTKFCKELSVGNGLDPSTQMGPLSNIRRLHAMQSLVDDAVSRGARIEVGGQRIGSKGFFFEPTVLTNVNPASRIMADEPFGPVAPILPFSSEDDVLASANSVRYELSSYLFTNDVERQKRFIRGLQSGVVGVNDVPSHVAEVPLGGWGESGFGVEGGIEALDAYTVSKLISTR